VSIIEKNPSNANLAAALAYARRGWRVFPCHTPVPPRRVGFGSSAVICCSCGSSKCTYPGNAGKHPRTAHGFKDAATDERQIRAWWSQWSGANIGIATGDGLVVVDVDPRHQGDKTLAQHERKNSPIPDDAKAISGSGGPHFYLTLPKGIVIASVTGGVGKGLGEGIDVKADNGYVVAPPSLHASGKRYRWATGRMPTKIPPAPDWIVKLSARVAKGGGSVGYCSADILTRDHPEGQLIAKLIGAKDCGTSWKFDCMARAHRTPDARMYPHEGGQIYFKCYSANPCSNSQIAAAIKEMLASEQEADQ